MKTKQRTSIDIRLSYEGYRVRQKRGASLYLYREAFEGLIVSPIFIYKYVYTNLIDWDTLYQVHQSTGERASSG